MVPKSSSPYARQWGQTRRGRYAVSRGDGVNLSRRGAVPFTDFLSLSVPPYLGGHEVLLRHDKVRISFRHIPVLHRIFVPNEDMQSPSRIAVLLRKISDRVVRHYTAEETIHDLRRVLEAMNEFDTVTLHGPFVPVDKRKLSDRNVFEGIVSGLIIDNDEFNQMIPDENKTENYVEDHSFHVKVDWYWSPPEPNVGWRGGIELDGWELIDLDGIALTADDAAAVEWYIQEAVDSQWNDWADEAETDRVEYEAELKAEARRY